MIDAVTWRIFELLVNCFECSLFLFFPRAILGTKHGKRRDFLAFFLCFVALVAIEYCYDFLWAFQNITFSALIFVYVLISLKGPIIKKVAISILPTVVVSMIAALTLFSSRFLFSLPLHEIFEPTSSRVLVVIISKTTYLVVMLLLIRVAKANQSLESVQWVMVCISFIAADAASSLLTGYTDFEVLNATQQRVFLLVSLCVALMSVLTFVTITKLSNEHEIKTQNTLLRHERLHLERNIEIARAGNAEMNHVKHDLKNYLLLISRLIDRGEYEEARAECERITGKIGAIVTFVEMDSQRISLAVNEKMALCRAQKIDISCAISCGTQGINEEDFCTVFSNLLDNAIEYSMGINPVERRIEFSIQEKLGFVNLCVSNFICSSVLAVNSELKTTKSSVDHGIGHQSVAAILHNCGGRVVYKERDSMFMANAYFPRQCE